MRRLIAPLLLPIGLILFSAAAHAAPALRAQLDALPVGDWLEYRVPLQPGQSAPCCFEWQGEQMGRRGCHLQKRPGSYGTSDNEPAGAPDATLRVLLQRGEQGVGRVLAVGEQCPVDAGSAQLRSIAAVDVQASVALLAHGIDGDGRRQRGEALHALALHAGTPADLALEQMAGSKRKDLRQDAIFWLAQARGERGFRVVRDLLDGADAASAGHLVFALSVSPVPAARPVLRELASGHAQPGIRGEALFWLAQKGDPQVEVILQQAMRNDPDQDVRRKAVFAISQLPGDRAVPILRKVVETPGESRELRKEALFWLAQIDDDAVIPVFDDLLGVGTR
jgi:hypothetical protein